MIHLYPITRHGRFKLVQFITGNGELSWLDVWNNDLNQRDAYSFDFWRLSHLMTLFLFTTTVTIERDLKNIDITWCTLPPPPRWGGYSTKFYTERLIQFWQEKVSLFCIPLVEKRYLFHTLSELACIINASPEKKVILSFSCSALK